MPWTMATELKQFKQPADAVYDNEGFVEDSGKLSYSMVSILYIIHCQLVCMARLYIILILSFTVIWGGTYIISIHLCLCFRKCGYISDSAFYFKILLFYYAKFLLVYQHFNIFSTECFIFLKNCSPPHNYFTSFRSFVCACNFIAFGMVFLHAI